MPAATTMMGVFFESVHEVRLVEKTACHLHSLKAVRENLNRLHR